MAAGLNDIALRKAAAPVTRWHIGDVSVRKIAETEMIRSVAASLPNADPRRLSDLPWLTGAFAIEDGNITFSLHSFVIETRSRRIVVDTCFGNSIDRHRDLHALPQQSHRLEHLIRHSTAGPGARPFPEHATCSATRSTRTGTDCSRRQRGRSPTQCGQHSPTRSDRCSRPGSWISSMLATASATRWLSCRHPDTHPVTSPS
jgi:hypothetical protein